MKGRKAKSRRPGKQRLKSLLAKESYEEIEQLSESLE
jgi:hypothetical protein